MKKYNRKRVIIKNLLTNYTNYIDKNVCIYGWIQTTRKQSELFFVSLNDGSSVNNIQIILSNEYYKNNIELIKEDVNTGASIKIEGRVIKSPAKGQEIEIQCHECEIIGKEVRTDPQMAQIKKQSGFGHPDINTTSPRWIPAIPGPDFAPPRYQQVCQLWPDG